MPATNRDSLYAAEAAVAHADFEVRRSRALARLARGSQQLQAALTKAKRRLQAAQRHLAKLLAKRRRERERLRVRRKLANARAGRKGRAKPCVTCSLGR